MISRGGNISFADKVLECQTRGGLAAIIVNNTAALFSGTLGGTVTTIPSVGIAGANDGALTGGLTATVTVLNGNYAFYDGTSMATPHVSGVAALVWSQDTSCTNAEIRNALAGTALDLGAVGRDVAYGYGLVQADAATDAILLGGEFECGSGGGICSLKPLGASCSIDSECCSGTCGGKPGKKTCK